MIQMAPPATIHTASGGYPLVSIGRTTFTLSHEHIRGLRFRGRTIQVRSPGGITGTGSFITPHPSGKAIEFHFGRSCWLLPRKVFRDVSTGELPVAELARLPELPGVVDR